MTPSLDQFLKDGREKKCVVPRALGKDCSDLCSCCFSFLTALKMLRRAVGSMENLIRYSKNTEEAKLGSLAMKYLQDELVALEQMAREKK